MMILPKFTKEEMDKKIAKEKKDLLEKVKSFDFSSLQLPELQGTERQVAYAKDLRDKFLKEGLEDLKKDCAELIAEDGEKDVDFRWSISSRITILESHSAGVVIDKAKGL